MGGYHVILALKILLPTTNVGFPKIGRLVSHEVTWEASVERGKDLEGFPGKGKRPGTYVLGRSPASSGSRGQDQTQTLLKPNFLTSLL